jgi:hypothetical protein
VQSLSPPSAAGKELDLYRIRPNTLHIGGGTAGLLGPSVGFGAGTADAKNTQSSCLTGYFPPLRAEK